MKKNITNYFLLTLSLICLGVSIFTNNRYIEFNPNNVKENIATLSSFTYNGRLPGSNENSLISEIIKKSFKDNNLTPINSDFKEEFNIICPVKTNTEPYLEILTDNITSEQLQYGVDFKEDMINFKINTLNFSKKDKINISTNSIEVTTENGNCLFYVPQKNDFSFRSSFSSDFSYDMVVMITTATFNKILDSVRNDLSVSIHVPFTTEEKTISNVVGVIKGRSESLPPLVLTAHYDHLGVDGLGNTYTGALDNASGTAFLLELQKSISTYGQPKRDIVFVALNAEEFGLLGSKEFAEKNIDFLKGSEVINFDMIGSEKFPITLMQGTSFEEKNSDLLESITEISKSKNTSFQVTYQNSSDHASFNNLGIDSLTFCHSDMSKIHTPNDKVDFISSEAIDSVYAIVDSKIKSSCFSIVTKFFYSKSSIFVFSILTGILCSLILTKKKKV